MYLAQHRGTDKKVILKMFIKKTILENETTDIVFTEQKVNFFLNWLSAKLTLFNFFKMRLSKMFYRTVFLKIFLGFAIV